MITVIVGNNAYAAEQEVRRIVAASPCTAERIDGADMTPAGLADIMRGGTLFAQARLVIVRGLAANTSLLEKLVEWAPDVPSDTTLVLIEEKLDKRTKAYKQLAKCATIIAVTAWTAKQSGLALEWLRACAKERGVKLSPAQAQDMIARATLPADRDRYIDQMMLARAVKSLALMDTVTDEAIDTVLPPASEDVAFVLLDTAVRGDLSRLSRQLDTSRSSDEPHKLFGLLASQWSTLATLAVAGVGSSEVAAALGVHPFVAQKLGEAVHSMTRDDAGRITRLAAAIDSDIKRSRCEPWVGIERLVYAIASRAA